MAEQDLHKEIDFIRWKDRVSNELESSKEKMTVLSDRIDSERARGEQVESLIREMKASFDKFSAALTGSLGMPGIIEQMKQVSDNIVRLEYSMNERVSAIEDEIDEIRTDISNRKSFVAGALFIGSIFGSIIGFLGKFLLTRGG
jgi:chromosome segregation ATPase